MSVSSNMASKYNSARVQCTKIQRFYVHDALHTVHMDISQDGTRLALSGWNDNTKDTFIDLFALKEDPRFQDLSLLMTSQPSFSKKFIKGSSWRLLRFVCLLDDSVFVTCCVDTIESYDAKHDRLVNRRKFTGEAFCMTTTRDGRVYVGLFESSDVIVFDRRLNHINKIKLKGLEGGVWPWDMTVNNNNKLFITTVNGRALIYDINGGDIEYEFKNPNQRYRGALSITDSEENGLIFVLWSDDRDKRVVVVYSLSGGHSSLPGGHSSLSGCHFLASLNVSDDSLKTRVNNNVNRLFVVTEETGEVYEYDTNDIINRENLLTLIELLITNDDCQKLLKYFKVPTGKAKNIRKSDGPSKTLLQHLRETNKISVVDINLLLTACNKEGISQVAEAWANYQKYGSQRKMTKITEKKKKQRISGLKESNDERKQLTSKSKMRQLKERLEAKVKEQQLTTTLEMTEEERKELSTRLKASDDERQQLTGRLETIEEEKGQLVKRLTTTGNERKQLSNRLSATEKKLQDYYDEDKRMKKIVEENQKELAKTKSNLRAAKDDLIQAQVKYAKESMVLQEVLEQTREALTKQTVTSTTSGEQVDILPKENKTSDVSQKLTALAGPEYRSSKSIKKQIKSERNQPEEGLEEDDDKYVAIQKERQPFSRKLQTKIESLSGPADQELSVSEPIGDTSTCEELGDMYIKRIINKEGGFLEIPGSAVRLEIPPGALVESQLIEMHIIPLHYSNDPLSFCSNASVVVELLPSNLELQKEAILTLPHCMVLKEGTEWKAQVYSSHHKAGLQPRWKENTDIHSLLKEQHCDVWLTSFSWWTVDISWIIAGAKRISFFAAKRKTCTNKSMLLDVGFYVDLVSEEKSTLMKYDVMLFERRGYLYKEKERPLIILLKEIQSDHWSLENENKRSQTLPFDKIAKADCTFCTFEFKGDPSKPNEGKCNFKMWQKEEESSELIFHLTDPRSPSGMDTNVTMNDIVALSKDIGDSWREIARALDLAEAEIENIEENYKKQEEVSYQILHKWMKKQGSYATYSALIKCLRRANRNDLADRLGIQM